jgi:uncharacterized protein
MSVISSVRIKSFRGVREGLVDRLGPISILVGPNNSGKSTCLEAIATVGAVGEPGSALKRLLRRGGPVFDALDHIVAEGSKDAELEVVKDNETSLVTKTGIATIRDFDALSVANTEGLIEPTRQINFHGALSHQNIQQHTLKTIVFIDSKEKISTPWIQSGQPFSTFAFAFVDVQAVRPQGALEEAYSSIERAGKVKVVVEAMKRAMSCLNDLRILKTDGEYILHAIFEGQKPVPIYLTGDGSKRLVELAAAILGVDERGVVLLEEPECFQHPRYLRELVDLLLFSAEQNRQIILSTHSIELVDLLLEAGEEKKAVEKIDGGRPFPIVHRMRLVDGKLGATMLDRAQALASRKDLLEDLRA